MTQLLCAVDQTLLSQDEVKVKVYNPGDISHGAALLPLMPLCGHPAAAAAAATGTFVFIVVAIAAIVVVSVAVAAAAFS
jgi:hypothetical protein